MNTAEKVYEKYSNGDSISDAELKFGIEFFDNLATNLFSAGPVFKLAAQEALRVRNMLHSFKIARK